MPQSAPAGAPSARLRSHPSGYVRPALFTRPARRPLRLLSAKSFRTSPGLSRPNSRISSLSDRRLSRAARSHLRDEVACSAAGRREPPFPRTELPATLGPRWQVEPYRAVERRNLDPRPQHCLVHRDRDRAEHVVTIPAKESVGRDLNRHI